jgi:hypothetical protein
MMMTTTNDDDNDDDKWKMECFVIPVIIGATGTVTKV